MSVPVKIYRTTTFQEGQTPSNPNIGGDAIYNPLNPEGGPAEELVPYLGALRNVNLGEFGISTGYVTFDTTPTGTPTTQGTTYWDDSKSTVALIMNGTIQHIGQDTFYYVKNSTGSPIPKGTCVRFAGTDGGSGHLLIEPFLANGTYSSNVFMGVTAETIANGSFGQVMHFGELDGINTSTYTAGALLYASTTVAGGFQTTVPVAPNNIVLVAAAINSKNNGTISVRPTYGSNINNDEGVKIVSPSNGQALLYNSTSQLWENGTVTASETIQTVSTNGTINDLNTTATTVVFTGTTVTLTGIVALANGTERTLINLTGSSLTIPYFSALSTASNRFLFSLKLPNRGIAKIKYSTDATNVWLLSSGVFQSNLDSIGSFSNDFISIGRTPANNIGLTVRSVLNTDSAYSLACERLDGTRTFEVRSLNTLCYTPMAIGGSALGASRALSVRGTASGGWPVEIVNFAGTSTTLFFDSGDIGMRGGIIMGAASSFTTPTARLDVRGKGTTTGITLLLEDSAGNNTFEFLDNGNLSIPSTNGAKIGTTTSQKLGFWNATPIVQPTTAIAESAFVENAGGTVVNDDSTFDGYTLRQIVKALRDAGLLA